MENENRKYNEEDSEFLGSQESKEYEKQPENKEPEIEVQLPRGYVQIQQLDKDGNPIPGTEFNTSEKIFNEVYQKRGFIVKKKAKY